jgi:predicted RNA binding protein YcfA (HicA-like mRNA interferase family)
MPTVEVETRRIIARLEREGWVNRGGGKHDAFAHTERPGELIVLPRHREQSIGVARDIAKRAGWR